MRYIEISLIKNTTAMTTSVNYINVLSQTFVKFTDCNNLKNFCREHGISLDKSSFTRERIFSLKTLMGLVLYPKARSIFIDELAYLESIGRKGASVAAFSKRRRLIPSGYIEAFHADMLSNIYRSGVAPERWNGHLLLACDGTTYTMPDIRSMKDYFLKGRKTGHSNQPLERGVVIKDVANDIIIGANMECYGEDETKLAVRILEDLPKDVSELSPVVIFDRKYCAYTLIDRLFSKHIDFIIRVKRKFNAEVDKFFVSDLKEQIVDLYPVAQTRKRLRHMYGSEATHYRVRLVRCSADVVVMTSLLTDSAIADDTLDDTPSHYAVQQMANAYTRRWTDETTIGFLKNNLQVEIFSSTNPNTMYQDFYSKVINYNIVTLLAKAAAEMRLSRKKSHMHRLGINRNDTLGIVAIKFWRALILNNLKKVWPDMLNQIGRNTFPIIPNRHNPRVFRYIKTSGKYVTMTNYKEAI